MTVAWVFPGQGSQKIGMAKQIENLPITLERFNYASRVFERNELDSLVKKSEDVVIANDNSSSQVVLSGSNEELDNLSKEISCKDS